jgi:hypothetical protein
MAFENLLGLSDAYMTMANNFYLYKDPNQSGRLTYIQSDMDHTIGTFLFDPKLMLSGNYVDHPNIFYRPLTKKIFSYPGFSKSYEDLLLKLTKTLINPAILDPYIDSIVNMIRPDVEWDALLPKVGYAAVSPLSTDKGFEEILDFFRNNSQTALRSNITSPIVTFDEAINGPYPPDTMESVKGFINKKSSAILEFYKQ